MHIRPWTLPAFIVSLISLAAGCGGGGADTPPQTTNATATSVAANTPDDASAEASSVTVIADGVETEAAQCVAIFLDSLRRGDERAANGVLTAKSREELAKTAYVIQPLGTPQGKYNIGRVGFPYEDKSVALVECTWLEPPTAGQEQISMDIVCEVHEEPEGWRISGIGVTIPGTEEALVLDFEDAASLQATIDAATGQGTPAQPPATTEARVAAQPANAQSAGNGLPAYPNPNEQISVDESAPPQLALPPQYGNPVNR